MKKFPSMNRLFTNILSRYKKYLTDIISEYKRYVTGTLSGYKKSIEELKDISLGLANVISFPI